MWHTWGRCFNKHLYHVIYNTQLLFTSELGFLMSYQGDITTSISIGEIKNLWIHEVLLVIKKVKYPVLTSICFLHWWCQLLHVHIYYNPLRLIQLIRLSKKKCLQEVPLIIFWRCQLLSCDFVTSDYNQGGAIYYK